jgi:hypothetical protein
MDEAKNNMKDSVPKLQRQLCLMCGKKLRNDITWHHIIPKMLNPRKNMLLPLHRGCHNRLNSIYVIQQSKPDLSKLSSMVGHARSIKMASNRFNRVMENILEQIEQNFKSINNEAELQYEKQKIAIHNNMVRDNAEKK